MKSKKYIEIEDLRIIRAIATNKKSDSSLDRNANLGASYCGKYLREKGLLNRINCSKQNHLCALEAINCPNLESGLAMIVQGFGLSPLIFQASLSPRLAFHLLRSDLFP